MVKTVEFTDFSTAFDYLVKKPSIQRILLVRDLIVDEPIKTIVSIEIVYYLQN